MKVAAIVPSLNPDKQFPGVIDGLITAGFERIYVVNDGSGDEYTHLFEEAGRRPECVLLRHEVNCGKGRALKTALEQYLREVGDCVGVVTVDGDGQHRSGDVVKVAQALEKNPRSLILGTRDFSQEDVPAKSRYGNKLTRLVFRLFCGITVTDTQTGLRGIPNAFARELLEVDGERYEFETNMLLETKRLSLPIAEVPISTVYIENNSASHFRPVADSLRIYGLILKYAFSSIVCTLMDFLLFGLLDYLLLIFPLRLFVCTAAARVCSALLNFHINRNIVFRSGGKSAALRYFLLSAAVMLCSYGGVWLLSELLPLPALPAKALTDGVLFVVNFNIQRQWVFKRREAEPTS